MLNRRLIRIKAFKVLFSKVSTGSSSLQQAEKELINSCEKSVDLYCLLLKLPLAIRKIARAKIENGLNKFYPTPEEANPNLKFVENKFIEMIASDSKFLDYCAHKGLDWSSYDILLKKIYDSIVSKDYYKEYMDSSDFSLEADYKLVRKIFEEELEDNELLDDALEEMNIYWADDLIYVINAINKSISTIAKRGKVDIPAAFLKEDDKDYALKLLTKSMIYYDEYTELIANFVSNWDLERLVSTDIALVVMGITEAIHFSSIPIKVTINEYVDISKFYSTQNSKVFVNGLLDRIIAQLKKDGKIEKSGRGLID